MSTSSNRAAGNVAGNAYDKYATTNPIERRMMTGFLAAFDALLDEVGGDVAPTVIVEVGAGEGRIVEHLAQRFPDATVAGVDLPDAELAGSWATLPRPMFFGDATHLPLADASVDLVVGLELLEHVPGPRRALDEIARVCSGRAIISVPREPIWRIGNVARRRYLNAIGNTPGHVNHWSARAFERFVSSTMRVEHVAHPLPWTMIVASPS